jgi:hypothetical protein
MYHIQYGIQILSSAIESAITGIQIKLKFGSRIVNSIQFYSQLSQSFSFNPPVLRYVRCDIYGDPTASALCRLQLQRTLDISWPSWILSCSSRRLIPVALLINLSASLSLLELDYFRPFLIRFLDVFILLFLHPALFLFLGWDKPESLYTEVANYSLF